MGSEQAWAEYDTLVRTGDFSDGSSDWGRRDRMRNELRKAGAKTTGLSINGGLIINVTLDPAAVAAAREKRHR